MKRHNKRNDSQPAEQQDPKQQFLQELKQEDLDNAAGGWGGWGGGWGGYGGGYSCDMDGFYY